ncbi:hypothetical protein GCM10009617_10370 [Leifsonia poae]|uniref:Uncharacterized protein n=1 Tax=Leifsonia poae TaxID=110933 RepID=A0A9W6H730_9MICO|nr:hypothetical protein GCM10017584_07120 [Leifsonia poae]
MLAAVVPDEPFDEQPVSASALMAAIADTVINVFLSLIASPSWRTHSLCPVVRDVADDNLLTGQKASWIEVTEW